MAPLPKRRHSTRRGGKRKAAIKLSLTSLSKCSNCGATKLPHRVCAQCGMYDGRQTVSIKTGKNREHRTQ